MSWRAVFRRSNLPFIRRNGPPGDCFVAKNAPRYDIHNSFEAELNSYAGRLLSLRYAPPRSARGRRDMRFARRDIRGECWQQSNIRTTTFAWTQSIPLP